MGGEGRRRTMQKYHCMILIGVGADGFEDMSHRQKGGGGGVLFTFGECVLFSFNPI